MIPASLFYGGAVYRAFTGDLILHKRSPRFLRVTGSSSPRIAFPDNIKPGHTFVISNVGGSSIGTSLGINLMSGQTALYIFDGQTWLTFQFTAPRAQALTMFSAVVMGGQPSPSAISEFAFATPSWISRTASPVDRDFAVGFMIGDRQYFTGDYPSDATNGPLTHEFSLASNSWRQVMSCPANHVRGTAGSCKSAGFAMSGDGSSAVSKFTRFAWVTKGVTPLYRPRASAGRYGGKIYWMPGEPINSSGLEYNPTTDSYVSIPVMGSTARYNATCLSVNGRVVVCGGKTSPSTAYDLVDEYSPVAKTWTVKSVLSIGSRHSGAGLMSLNRGFYAAGADGSDTAQNNVARLIGNAWVTIATGPTTWGVANSGVSR